MRNRCVIHGAIMMLSVLIANYIPTIQGLPWDNVRNACKLLY